MNGTDWVIPILVFLLVVTKVFLSKDSWYAKSNIFEIIFGLLIMGFSIWASLNSSESSDNLKSDLTKLVQAHTSDSINNTAFQKYLKDSLGLDRKGNSVIIVNRGIYNSFVQKHDQLSDRTLEETVEFAIKNDYAINRAAQLMREGKREGEIKLRSFWANPENEFDRKKAKKLYDEICDYYDSVAVNYIKETPFMIFSQDGYIPSDKYEKRGLESAINEMNDSSTNLDRLAILIHGFSISARKPAKCFRTSEINKWYNSLKK